MIRACDRCLGRSWLIGRLAANLEPVRSRVGSLLALQSDALIEAVGGENRSRLLDELERFDPAPARERIAHASVAAICRCDARYPVRLLALKAPPAVIYVAGAVESLAELAGEDPVAVVGARRASSYGIEVARWLGRGLAAADVTVVSGMALGIDSAAHAGALECDGRTVAVLPGGADRPYPPARRALYRQLRERGAAISELPPGTDVWRWMFPARNRLIAAISAMTIVVEAGERSGSLLTARAARTLGRLIGAVPGRITSTLAAGPNELIADGARIVRGPQEVLDHLFGAGARSPGVDRRPELEPQLQRLLAAIGDGHDTKSAVSRAGYDPGEGLAALAELEIAGYLRRELGGRYAVLP